MQSLSFAFAMSSYAIAELSYANAELSFANAESSFADAQIEEEFQMKNRISLERAIKEICSGNWPELLA